MKRNTIMVLSLLVVTISVVTVSITEFQRALATFPELPDEELAKFQPILDETYGKIVYFWNLGGTYLIGETYILVV